MSKRTRFSSDSIEDAKSRLEQLPAVEATKSLAETLRQLKPVLHLLKERGYTLEQIGKHVSSALETSVSTHMIGRALSSSTTSQDAA